MPGKIIDIHKSRLTAGSKPPLLLESGLRLKDKSKVCPRCKHFFDCDAFDILQCQCNTIKLSAEESRFIKSGYKDCLCLVCLEELKELCASQKAT